MVVISRMPVSDISNVRGIGVADIASTSTEVRSDFRYSLCSTPKRCSSSTITRPRSLNRTVCCRIRCVPMTMSTPPSRRPVMIASASLPGVKRDSSLMVTGNCDIRSVNVVWCWCASSVVGTSTATCLPSCTALNAARTATSVLPYPTSPQMIRSIGIDFSMSALTSSMAANWSGVSVYGKASSSSRCHGVSGPKACPCVAIRAL